MVISKISMGVGNQMFQYAAGKSLALHHNCPFKLDISTYKHYTLRQFELENFFELQAQKAAAKDLEQFVFNHPIKRIWNRFVPKNKMKQLQLPYEEEQLKRVLLKLYDRIMPPYSRSIYIEPEYHFDSKFFLAPTPTYLHGYWMSWKYFEKIEEIIREDFTIKPNLVKHLEPVVQQIQRANGISIHIRRGDFTLPNVSKNHGLLPLSYYINAMDYFTAKHNSANFYIFSDDIDWAKENLPNRYSMKFISKNISQSALEDFYLMTKCSHNIIANSTFSWWAAFLNDNIQKEVIAPKNWYATKKFNTKDVYPVPWTILN